ncbi:MAG: protein translocase subunit SecF [Armatimonadota bacterium]|nr:protein translocase subunit SecF [Armatimonadota bacterium]MDR5702787.1 protein translocase subunit SecF [Armatimonadota bacterium]MDR7435699.1 protein translocase subunit SecF [Armatimonadota bacterium]
MKQPSWDIIGKRKWGYLFSLLVIIPGIIALSVNGLNLGVDFTGGTFLDLRLEKDFTTGQVRQIFDRFGLGRSIIQKGAGRDLSIRTRFLSEEERVKILQALRQEFGEVTVLRADEVGPRIGRELRNIAILGVAIGLLLQVVYISYRFKSVRFAVAADIALLHDILVVLAAFSLTRKEVNSSFVAVLLTVVGYSINDTIVLFDRIRENLAMRAREPFDRLVNRSILEALVRSLNTSITTILAIGAVYFFGGTTIRDFAFGLMVGIATGAYSSIFTASPLLVDWHLWAQRRKVKPVEARLPAVGPSPVPATASPATSPGGQPPRKHKKRRK